MDDTRALTLQDFLALLQQTPCDWYLDEGGRIRRMGTSPRADSLLQSPLTAVCQRKTGRSFLCWRSMSAAAALSLSEILRHDIVNAADAIEEDHDPDLRLRLLTACGLESTTEKLPELDVSKIHSPVLARLIEEARSNEEIGMAYRYNRYHNRHNRS